MPGCAALLDVALYTTIVIHVRSGQVRSGQVRSGMTGQDRPWPSLQDSAGCHDSTGEGEGGRFCLAAVLYDDVALSTLHYIT